MRWYSLPPRLLQTFAWGPTRTLLNTFTHFRVRGAHRIRHLRQAIFAANHANELDPIIVTAALSPLGRFAPMYYVARGRDFYPKHEFGWKSFIYGGTFFKAWGAYPALAGMKDYARSLEAHHALLRHGHSLCMFPEGGRTRDGNLREAHGGIGYLLHATQVPVVPVAIKGTFQLSPQKFLSGRHRVSVTFGEPLLHGHLYENIVEPTPEHHKLSAQRILSEVANLLEPKGFAISPFSVSTRVAAEEPLFKGD